MYSYVLLSLFLLANLQGSDCDKKELKPPFNVANTLALGLQTNTKNFSVTFYTELGERPLRMQFSFTDPPFVYLDRFDNGTGEWRQGFSHDVQITQNASNVVKFNYDSTDYMYISVNKARYFIWGESDEGQFTGFEYSDAELKFAIVDYQYAAQNEV